jgi:hypothetical protein
VHELAGDFERCCVGTSEVDKNELDVAQGSLPSERVDHTLSPLASRPHDENHGKLRFILYLVHRSNRQMRSS